MSKITEKPAGLPTGNDVDPTLLEEQIDSAYVAFRCTNIKVEDPIELGEAVTYVVYGKVIATGVEEHKDGELRQKRTIQVTGVHKPGKRPTIDPDQSPLFSVVTDTDGTSIEGPGGED